jgi:signal transduction histidine kinase
MDIKQVALIFVFFVNLCLGSVVYLKRRKNLVNITFGILTISIALWTIGVLMIVSVWNHSNPILYARLTYALGTFMATSFAIFSLVFSNEEHQKVKKYIYILCPTAIVLAIISLSPFSIKKIVFEEGRIVKTYYGFGNVLWAIYVISCLAIAFYRLGRSWREGSGIGRLRIQYMFLGIALTTTTIAFTNIFIPLILGYEDVGAYGPCFTMIMVGCIAYAIIKHRLMDIRVFIKKGIIYSALLAVSTLLMGLLVIEMPRLFPAVGKAQSFIILLLGGAFMVFILRPFSHNLRDLINAFVSKDQYLSQQTLRKFNRLVTNMLNLDSIFNLIFNTAVEIMKVDMASLLFLDSASGDYKPNVLLGLKPSEMKFSLSSNSKIVRYLEDNREPVVKEELERNLSLEEFDKMENDFRSLRAEIFIPLFAEDRLIGILNLGSKSTGRIYYEEDINMLMTIVDQSSVAIQNALLHKQVVEMKNYNEAILENLTSGIIAIDSSFKITTVNQAASKILEIEIDNTKGTDVSYLPKYIGDLLIATQRGEFGFRDLEANITTTDKKVEKTILSSTTVLRDEKQQVTGSIVVFSDISELKAVEEEIRQTEKLSSLGRFAAEMAHEIKNPLVTIKTFFELLMENENAEEFDKEFLNLAISETNRINELIRQILDLTRRPPASFSWCNLNQILDETIMILNNNMNKRNIQLSDIRGNEPIEIYADGDQLKQMLINIGMNAVDAMGNDGKLTIEASIESSSIQLMSRLKAETQNLKTESHANIEHDCVIIKVSDTGTGIPKEDLDKIFEPFYTTKNTGTGLGLAIVNNIIRDHKGVITVESDEGAGTTFIIELPLSLEKVMAVGRFDNVDL